MGRGGVTWVAAALIALGVLVVASSGTVHVWEEPPPASVGARDDTPAETIEPGSVEAPVAPPPPEPQQTESVLGRVVSVAGLAVLLYVLAIVVSFWARAIARRERRDRSSEQAFDALPVVAPAVSIDLAAHRMLLADGVPRNAIVACWARLEADAAAAGLPRHPAETSAEYTARVVGSASIDPLPIRDLAELYREARFSTHDLGEAERVRAIDALERVHAALPLADRVVT